MSWKRWTAIGAGVAVLAVGGVVVGRMTAEEAAGDQLLIVPRPVERRDLDDVLTINAVVRREATQEINLPVDGKVSSIEVEDGETVEPGDALFALDGRTAVAVEGNFAFFRTLDVGSDGPDVLQLETILADAGYPIESVDTLFTEDTRRALTQWQLDRGYGGATPEPVETITVSLAPNQAGYQIGKANTVAYSIQPSVPDTAVAGFTSGGAGTNAPLLPGRRLVPPPPTTPPTTPGTTAPGTAPGTTPGTTTPGTTTPGAPVGAAAAPVRPTITLTSDVGEVDEGGQVVLTFRAEPAPASPLTVDLTIGGDAANGNDPDDGDDYGEIDDSFVFPAGATTYTITLPVWVDSVIEDREDINVSLTDQFGNDPNYIVGPQNEVRVRIRANGDDLVPVITVESSSAVVQEGATVAFTFRSTVESNRDLDLTVVAGGSARSGSDYAVIELDDIAIPAGATSTTVQVQLRADGVVEGDERLTLAVVPDPDDDPADPSYAPGNPASVSVLIESNDLPELTLRGGGDIAEGEAASFTIVADAPVTADTSVNYQLGGTANAGDDFETLSGTVILPAGRSEVTVPITTIDDDVVFLPSDMVVADWPARVGTVEVDEGEFVLQGAPVLTLTEPVFTITLQVGPGERAELEVGQTALVSLDAVDGDLPGVIATLDDAATVDEQGAESYEGTVVVEGDFDAVDGASATVDVTLSERLGVLAVPVAAVLRSAGGDVVRVVNDEGTITRVPVTIGLVDGEWVEITSGLVGDELVIVDVDAAAEPTGGGGGDGGGGGGDGGG
jgi:multidrug efflux pump subunit AcrA (membrane-fusion protein)